MAQWFIVGYLVGKAALEDPAFRFSDQERAAFLWGTAGPGFLPYFKFPRGDSRFFRLAEEFGRTAPERLFSEFHRYAVTRKNSNESALLAAYLRGLCCYYVLLRRAGAFLDGLQDPEEKRVRRRSERISEISTALYRRTVREQPSRFAPREIYALDEQTESTITRLYVSAARGLFSVKIRAVEVSAAMDRFLRIQSHCLGWRGWVIRPAELVLASIFGTKRAMLPPPLPKEGKGDVLNLRHLPWKTGLGRGILLDYSFPEVVVLAKEEGEAAADYLLQCISRGLFLRMSLPNFSERMDDTKR